MSEFMFRWESGTLFSFLSFLSYFLLEQEKREAGEGMTDCCWNVSENLFHDAGIP